MATIHISEIQDLLAARGERDARPYSPNGYFLEIRFDEPGAKLAEVDPEYKNRVITADCPFGGVTIQFDEYGQLRSLDLS